jgi:hypothetical protein
VDTNDVTGPAANSDRPAMLTPRPAERLDGSEHFVGMDATVADFWRWAFSDLRDNITRGVLAEFLVAKAVGGDRRIRVGFDNYDTQSDDGTRIEVKCSAYLQSWSQRTHSSLHFGRLYGRSFDPDANAYSTEPTVRADVFVFAVQTQRDPDTYDMLDLRHWDFYVVHGDTVRAGGTKSVSFAWVTQHAQGPLPWKKLADAIRTAAGRVA